MPDTPLGTVLSGVADRLRSLRGESVAAGEDVVGDRLRVHADAHSDPMQEARWLVAAVLDLSPAALSHRALGESAVTAAELAAIDRALVRRMRGEPLAYAVGTAAFRELVLQVDRRVLIPRPETEIVVGEALRVTADRPGGIAVDIGTGSGAIALSLALEGRFDRVIATDISVDALEVARNNAERLTEQLKEQLTEPLTARQAAQSGTSRTLPVVEFRPGADLAPVGDVRARVLVSNPPYIAYEEAATLPASVRDWEPPVALFAADEGMARYRALLSGARHVLEPGGWIVLELDARRARRTAALAEQEGFETVQVIRDLSDRERVLVARHRS